MIEELIDTYQLIMKRYARSIARNQDESEDLLSETMSRALNNINLLETFDKGRIKSWLFTTMRNILIDTRRKEKKIIQHPDYEPLCSNHNDFEEIETCIAAEELLQTLPPHLREIIFKKYFLNMTSVQIAKELSIPDSTVRYYHHLAIKILKEKNDLPD